MTKPEFIEAFMARYRSSFIERYGEVDGGSRQIRMLGALAAGMLFDLATKADPRGPELLLGLAAPEEQ